MIYIGVDPGASSGAIALLFPDKTIRVHDIPSIKTGKFRQHDSWGIYELLREPLESNEAIALIEKVQFDQRDVTHMRSAEGLVRCQEAARTILVCLGAGVIDAYPPQWRKQVGLSSGDKESAIKAALQLFPAASDRIVYQNKNKSWTRNHNRAEALLMAETAKILSTKSVEVA